MSRLFRTGSVVAGGLATCLLVFIGGCATKAVPLTATYGHPQAAAPFETWWHSIPDSPMQVSWSERFFHVESTEDREVLAYTLGCLGDKRPEVERKVRTVEFPSEAGAGIMHPALFLNELRTSNCGAAKLGITSVRFADGGEWDAQPAVHR